MHDHRSPESPKEYAARVQMRYLSGVPKKVPPGRVVVHNCRTSGSSSADATGHPT